MNKTKKISNKKAYLDQEKEHYLTQLSLLYSVGVSTTMVLEMQRVLKEILYEAICLFKAEIGAIFLLDENLKEFNMEVYVGLSQAEKITIKLGENKIVDEIIKTGNYKVLLEPAQVNAFSFLLPYRPKTIIIFPIKIKSKVEGMMYLVKLKQEDLTKEDKWLLSILVNRIGVALESSRIYEKLKKTTTKLELLLKINNVIASENLLELLCPSILKELIAALNVSSSTIGVINKELRLIQSWSITPKKTILYNNLPLTEGIYGYVMKHKKNLILNDIKTLKFDPLLPKELNIKKSILCIQIKASEQIIGFFSIHDPLNKEEFTQEDEFLCDSIADIISVGIQRSRAYEQLMAVEKATAISRIVSEIVHEVKNPLTTIKIGLFYLKKTLVKDDKADKINKKILQLEEAAKRVSMYIEDLLNFSIPPILNLTRVNINTLIDEVLEELPSYIKKNIDIKKNILIDLPNILADPNRIKQVFVNVIKNAAEAMPFGGSLTITLSCLTNFIRIDFEDEGYGIPEEDMPYVFDPFFTRKEKGTGLGLPICKKIIESHNGTIEIKSKEGGGGTVVSIKLPI